MVSDETVVSPAARQDFAAGPHPRLACPGGGLASTGLDRCVRMLTARSFDGQAVTARMDVGW